MKFKKIYLKSFGPFTDHEIDFSKGDDNAGLHVVFGLNEEGKSSALRAIGALLFGIDKNTKDNFVHDNSQLRVGADLTASNNGVSFLRKKGNKGTLLSKDTEDVLDDNFLNLLLKGISKEMFFKEYAIDHNQLMAGGKALLDNKGEVGQSLFAAGHGIVNIQNLIESLQTDADEIYTSRKKRMVYREI